MKPCDDGSIICGDEQDTMEDIEDIDNENPIKINTGEVNIMFVLLQKFMKAIKKDHPDFVKLYEYQNVKITNDGNKITLKGYYDCPPTYFEYSYGIDTNWKLKKIK